MEGYNIALFELPFDSLYCYSTTLSSTVKVVALYLYLHHHVLLLPLQSLGVVSSLTQPATRDLYWHAGVAALRPSARPLLRTWARSIAATCSSWLAFLRKRHVSARRWNVFAMLLDVISLLRWAFPSFQFLHSPLSVGVIYPALSHCLFWRIAVSFSFVYFDIWWVAPLSFKYEFAAYFFSISSQLVISSNHLRLIGSELCFFLRSWIQL